MFHITGLCFLVAKFLNSVQWCCNFLSKFLREKVSQLLIESGRENNIFSCLK